MKHISVLKKMIGLTLTATIAQLGFMPNECGDPVKSIIAGKNTAMIIALGAYLDDCRKAGNYDPLVKGVL